MAREENLGLLKMHLSRASVWEATVMILLWFLEGGEMRENTESLNQSLGSTWGSKSNDFAKVFIGVRSKMYDFASVFIGLRKCVEIRNR